MKRMISIIVIILIIVILVACFLFMNKNEEKDSLDGNWVEIQNSNEFKPCTLSIKGNTIKYKCYDEVIKANYNMEEDKIVFVGDSSIGEYMIVHDETINGIQMKVISEFIFEYDGRGAIVSREYVKKENIKKVDLGYKSELAIESLRQEVIPTVIEDEDNNEQ